MGFFDELKKAADTIKDGFEEAVATQQAHDRANLEALGSGPIEILNPTPQAEIDAGAQRGVITWTKDTLESGDDVWRTEVVLGVRARQKGGELGPDTRLKLWTSSRIIRQLRRGMEIPVELDAEGVPVKLDHKTIAAELKKKR